MYRLQEIAQAGLRQRILDAKRDDLQSQRKSLRNLSAYMTGTVRIFGKHEHEYPTGGDSSHDPFGPIGPVFNVPRGHPAWDLGRLQLMANSICYRLVLTRMANKDLWRHGALPVRTAL